MARGAPHGAVCPRCNEPAVISDGKHTWCHACAYEPVQPIEAGAAPRVVGRGLVHGTSSAYRAGCRCPDCRAANAARQRASRKRKAAREQEVNRGQ